MKIFYKKTLLSKYCYLLIVTGFLTFLLQEKAQAQQYTADFATAPVFTDFTFMIWYETTEVTLGGVVYQIKQGGNDSWTYRSTGGKSNSGAIHYSPYATGPVTIQRKDGKSFNFFGVWLKYTNTRDPVYYPPPYLTVSYPGSAEQTVTFTYDQTVELVKNVTVTSVVLNFTGLNDLLLDNLSVGPAVLSTNANLSNLTLSAGSFDQVFSQSTTIYTATLPYANSTIKVTPTLADTKGTVTVNGIAVNSGSASGAITLNEGTNTITVVTTAEDGTTLKTYTITVTRQARVEGFYQTFSGGFNPMAGVGATIAGASSFVTGDFNGDGFEDLVGRAPANNAVVFWKNNGDGTWSQLTGSANPFNAISFTASAANFIVTNVAVLDIDGDGDLDIYNNALNQFWKNNNGTFIALSGSSSPLNGVGATIDGANSFVTGDFNGDGFEDLAGRVPADNAVVFWKNNGDGTWTQLTGTANPFNAISFTASVSNFVFANTAVLDVDGDGDLDIYNNFLNQFWQNNSGVFTALSGSSNPMNGVSATIDNASSFVTGDFNGDGYKDLAGRVPPDNAVAFWKNNGDGTWTQQTGTANPFIGVVVSTSSQFVLTNVAVLDVDGDGDLDIFNNGINEFWSASGSAPTLTSSTPANNALDAQGFDDIVLNFSEAITTGTGNIYIKKVADNSIVQTIAANSSDVTGSGTSTITINPPADLAALTAYYVVFENSAFKDSDGFIIAMLDDHNNIRKPYITSALLKFTTAAACTSTPVDQDFEGYTNINYPTSITLNCIKYSSTATGGVGVGDKVEQGLSYSPVLSGNVLAFYDGVEGATARLSSVNSSVNFKIASLAADFYGHSNGNSAEKYNIIGYDNGVEVLRVSNFIVTASGVYGDGNKAITYNRNPYNNEGNNSGTLTFGTAWSNIDQLKFQAADESPNNYLFLVLDNINFEDAVIQSAPTDYFRTITSGNWSAPATWQSSPVANFSSGVANPATLSPDSTAKTITIQAGDTVTLSDERTIDQVVIKGSLLVAPTAALTVSNGSGTDVKVNAGGSLTLQSSAAGTARVAPLPGGTTITGEVTVERYFPARRAWRLVTAPLSDANTIYQAWQNNGVYETGKGTLITGPYVGNGLDNGRTYSLKAYDFASQSLVNVANTSGSLSNPGSSAANKAFFLFVRGDRTPLNLTPPNTNTTTLSATGTLQTGNQVFSAAGAAGMFGLLGNPYASPVDFDKLTRTNVAKRFYAWDPALNEVGGYVLLDDIDNNGIYSASPSSQLTQHIQSGQAFFVQIAAAGPASLTFSEADKSSVVSNAAFKGIDRPSSMRTDLYRKTSAGNIYTDGVLSEYNNGFTTGITLEDAPKMTNINENLAIQRSNESLALERRPALLQNDTTFLKLWNTRPGSYSFTFTSSNLSADLAPMLEDSYLGTSTELSISEPASVPFTVTADAGSANPGRFRIVFKKPSLPDATSKPIVAYPNPLTGNMLALQFTNQPEGKYLLQVYNKAGQRLLSKTIEHPGGSATQTIQLPGIISRGTYQLKISNGKTVTVQQLVRQ